VVVVVALLVSLPALLITPVSGTPAGFSAPVAGLAVASLYGPTVPVPLPSAPVEEQVEAAEEVVETGLAAAAVAAASAVAARSPGLDLRVAVYDREVDELAAAGAAAEPTYTASLSKLVVAVDVLDRRRSEGLEVRPSDLDLFARALGPSDDSAMNALWSRFDGASAASRVSARLGLTGTLDPRDPSQWGEMRVSAEDELALLRHVLAMPAEDREVILGALGSAPAVARDGFAQDFGLLAPGTPLGDAAAKQGWMCCFGQRYYLHSVGVVGDGDRFLVALLSLQPRAAGWQAARTRLDEVAVAMGSALGGTA
jgi:hypothetical protein